MFSGSPGLATHYSAFILRVLNLQLHRLEFYGRGLSLFYPVVYFLPRGTFLLSPQKGIWHTMGFRFHPRLNPPPNSCGDSKDSIVNDWSLRSLFSA
jgi:hypothetical protein